MNSYAVSVGARNSAAAGHRFSARDERLIRKVTRAYFPNGFTILEARGGWWDPDKKNFVREETRQIQVNSSSWPAVRRWALHLGRTLGQKEIVVARTGTAVTLAVHAPAKKRIGLRPDPPRGQVTGPEQ